MADVNQGNQGNNPGNQGNNPGNQGNNPGQSLESRQSTTGQAGGQQRMEPLRERFALSRPGSPFSLMRRWMNDMDRWFGDFGSSGLSPRFDELGQAQSLWSPQIDIFEREGNLVVHADLPGLRQEDVRVSVDRGMLTVSGQRRHEAANEREGNVYYRERSFGSFQRSVTLPENVDTSQIRASFENGVLEVMLPMPQQARQQGREIPIGPKEQAGPKH
jgi:HSP20 family protein